MGLFDSLTGSTTETKTCLHFYDNGPFKFLKREINSACFVEKKDAQIVKGWKHFFATELWFPGYRGIKADGVTITSDRDMILDPFNKVKTDDTPAGGKPKKDQKAIKEWTAQVAEAQRYIVMNKPTNMLLINKITMFLGAALILELLAMFALKAMK